MSLYLPHWLSDFFSVNFEISPTRAFLIGNAVGLLWVSGVMFHGLLPTGPNTTVVILSAGYLLVSCYIWLAHDPDVEAAYLVGVVLSALPFLKFIDFLIG